MQVVARWNPSGARRPVLEEAPVFYPSEEVSYAYHTVQ
jgi:histone demethylase JARID1